VVEEKRQFRKARQRQKNQAYANAWLTPLRHVDASAGFATIDSVDPLAGEAEHLVEAAQLHSVNVRVLVGHLLQHRNILANLPIHFAAEDKLRSTQPTCWADWQATLGVGEARRHRSLIVERPEEDVDAPLDARLAATIRRCPPMIEHAVNWRKVRRPVVVEQVILSDAKYPAQQWMNHLGGANIHDADAGVRGFKAHTDFVHPLQVISKGVVDRAAVFDLVEVVNGQFEWGRDGVKERPEEVIIVGVDGREDRCAVPRLDPDHAMFFARFKAIGAGVQLRRAGAFAVSAGVEGPAVILALDLVIDDAAIAEFHATMRANIINSGDLLLGIAEQTNEPSGQLNARSLVHLEFLAGINRMPMIEHTHLVALRVCIMVFID
jgi:hypothetical protein